MSAADIHSFIVDELLPGRGIDAVDHGDDLLAMGVIDSHGVIELVGFLETRFGVSIADEDLTPENFSSITSIEQFVASKSNVRG